MRSRLWYPQLDVYDTIRRILLLLHKRASTDSCERLYIADFFLANPPLLHGVKMTQPMRSEFYNLQIQRPKDSFLSYPEPQFLFKKMEPIQRKAIQELAARNMICSNELKIRHAVLTASGLGFAQRIVLGRCPESENELADFILSLANSTKESSLQSLQNATGLRRMT